MMPRVVPRMPPPSDAAAEGIVARKIEAVSLLVG